MIVYAIFIDNNEMYEDAAYDIHSLYSTEELAKRYAAELQESFDSIEHNNSTTEIKEMEVRDDK